MKKLLQIVLISCIATSTFGQIDKNLTNGNWKPEEEKVICDNTIIRVEGKNDMRGMTNIGYETLAQLKVKIEKDAEKEMWTEEKKKQKIELYNRAASGGLIHLYLTRLTIDAANTEMFTIIVRDSSETEIFRKELKSDVPEVPSSGSSYWWNYALIPLPKIIQNKIYVYVIDRLGNDNSKFKFEIKL
jgi:hypothetical protein